MTDERYPYTYACDYIRTLATEIRLSRSDASKIREGIANVLCIDDETLACLLANYYLENKDYITEKTVKGYFSVNSPFS